MDLDAEAAVLSAIILKPECINEVRELLRDGATFYSVANRRIYECALELWDASQKVDNVTITRLLRDREFLQQVGGVAYIAQITDATPAIANVEAHARLVFDLWRRRQAIMVSQEVGASGYVNEFGANSPERVQEYIDGAAERFLELSMHLQKRDLRHVGDVLRDAYGSLQAAKERGSAITGMCTGLTRLDETISGLQRGDLYIIAARPSKGKTALVIRMLLGLARTGEPCALFSLEMPDVQIAHRILASEAKVDISKLRKATIDPEGWSRMATAVNDIATLPLWIDDGAALTMPDLRGRVRRFNAKRDIEKLPRLSVVAVDYLQLMTVPRVEGGRWTNREQQVADNSRGLKRMAKDDGLAMIVLAQLNREIEKRGGEKRPQLSDIRECFAAGEQVYDARTGEWRAIEALSKGDAVVGMLQWRTCEGKVARVWKTGRRPVFVVRTRTGRELRVTANHPVRTWNGWQEVRGLVVGERIAVPRSLPEPTHPENALTIPEARMLGYLISDGSYIKHRSVSYTKADAECLTEVERIARSRFGIVAKRQNRGGSTFDLDLTTARIGPSRNPLIEWLKKLGIHGQRGEHKRVPAEVFSLDNTRLAQFLATLWAGDGTVVRRPHGGYVLKFVSTSRGLLHDVQLLLLRLGVISVLGPPERNSKSSMDIATLAIHERDAILTFAASVRMPGVKGERLRNAAKTLRLQGRNEQVDRLPLAVTEDVARRKRVAGLSWRTLGYRCQGKEIGRHHLRYVAARLEAPDLEALATSDVLWDQVVAIERDGTADVFDVSVPKTGNLIVSGFFAHNSGSVEQDADTVMFVHRPDSKDGGDTGQAEIIVAKQRNGPTMSVDLAFISKHAHFENLARDEVYEWDGTDSRLPDD